MENVKKKGQVKEYFIEILASSVSVVVVDSLLGALTTAHLPTGM
jgi:hypothetical protein